MVEEVYLANTTPVVMFYLKNIALPVLEYQMWLDLQMKIYSNSYKEFQNQITNRYNKAEKNKITIYGNFIDKMKFHFQKYSNFRKQPFNNIYCCLFIYLLIYCCLLFIYCPDPPD